MVSCVNAKADLKGTFEIWYALGGKVWMMRNIFHLANMSSNGLFGPQDGWTNLASDFFGDDRFRQLSEEELEGAGEQRDVLAVVQRLVDVAIDFKS